MKFQPDAPTDDDLGYYFDVKMNENTHESLWVRTHTHAIKISSTIVTNGTARLQIVAYKLVCNPETGNHWVDSGSPQVLLNETNPVVLEQVEDPGSFPAGL